MKKYKYIFIDGLLLLVVSTIIVAGLDFLVTSIKKVSEVTNPVAAAIIRGNDKKIIQDLCTSPERLQSVDDQGRTVLIIACYANFKLEQKTVEKDIYISQIIPILLKGGVPINAVDKDNWNALTWAAWSNLPLTAEELIKNGIQVNITDKVGNTPLSIAKQRNNSKIIDLLIAAGAQ